MKVAILSGSVYGTAEEVARHAERLFKEAGFDAWHAPRMSLDELKAFEPEAFLTVTATTGMGELPENLQPLYFAIRDQLPASSSSGKTPFIASSRPVGAHSRPASATSSARVANARDTTLLKGVPGR